MRRHPRIEKAAWFSGAVAGFGGVVLALPVAFLVGPKYSAVTILVGMFLGIALLLVSFVASGQRPTISAMD